MTTGEAAQASEGAASFGAVDSLMLGSSGAAEKEQHSSFRGSVQEASWLSLLWDQHSYCGGGTIRAVVLTQNRGTAADAELPG